MRINIINNRYCFILYENKMRVISKIICWIFIVFILFILVNLVLWVVQYWWTKNYSEYLNKKNRDESVANVRLLEPKTRLSIFYDVDGLDADIDVGDEITVDNNLWIADTEVKQVNHNPYDPDYEDEFNSFFAWSSEETWNIISVQDIENIEDLWDAWFKIDENTED